MQITLSNAYTLIEQYNKGNLIDLTELQFIQPIGLAILASIQQIDKNVKIISPKNKSVAGYIDFMLNSLDIDISIGNSYIIAKIDDLSQATKTAKKIADKIVGSNSYSDLADTDRLDLKLYLKYMIYEILDNAIEHGSSNHPVIITTQHYNSGKDIQVAFADNGIGFKNSLSNKYEDIKTNKEAIEKALQKGITGSMKKSYTIASYHPGYGLYCLSEIIKDCKGRLEIISGNGSVKIKNSILETPIDLSCEWNGSIIAFQIKEKNIEHEFDFIMSKLRSTDKSEDIF